MADRNESAQELLLDVRVAEASKLYKFYLSQEKKILGAAGVTIFLISGNSSATCSNLSIRCS